MTTLVTFILNEYKVLGANRHWKKIDPRLLLENRYDRSDETATLRLAITRDSNQLFTDLWSQYYEYFTEWHLYELVKFMVEYEKYSLLEQFLWMGSTQRLFQISRYDIRNKIVSLITNESLSTAG